MRERNERGQFVPRPVPVGMKYCPACDTIKSRDEFTRGRTRPDGLQPRCKACAAARMRARRADDPAREQRIHRTRVARGYDLTLDEYDALVSRACEICGTTERARVVDHCHRTHVVRGALCSQCNTALGLLGDNAERMLGAASYLRHHSD